MAYEKPLPILSERNLPFWEAAKRGELRMQRCLDCGHIRYPIGPVCTDCLSERTEWVQLSGRGRVFAYCVFYQLYNPAFKEDIPYNVAIIQLDEGPRMISNVVGCNNEEVKIGDRVGVVFDPVTEDVSIPRFRLLRGQEQDERS